jgi:hypothetical protein
VSLSLLAHLVHQRPEVVHVLEAAVDAGEAHVGDFVELLELAHDEFAQAGGGGFAGAGGEQLFLDALDGRVNLLGADRAFAQRQHERAAQLGAVVVGAAAVLLDDGGEADVGPLVGTDRKFNRMRPSMARVLGLETRSAKEG